MTSFWRTGQFRGNCRRLRRLAAGQNEKENAENVAAFNTYMSVGYIHAMDLHGILKYIANQILVFFEDINIQFFLSSPHFKITLQDRWITQSTYSKNQGLL